MDVTCANCGEPWDTYHLRHDEVHETAAGQLWMNYKLDMEDWEAGELDEPPQEPEIEEWEGKLTNFWRGEFEALGWKFGSGVTVVLRCTCCRDDKKLPDAEERGLLRKAVGELLMGDEDGIDAELEDLARKERFGVRAKRLRRKAFGC